MKINFTREEKISLAITSVFSLMGCFTSVWLFGGSFVMLLMLYFFFHWSFNFLIYGPFVIVFGFYWIKLHKIFKDEVPGAHKVWRERKVRCEGCQQAINLPDFDNLKTIFHCPYCSTMMQFSPEFQIELRTEAVKYAEDNIFS